LLQDDIFFLLGGGVTLLPRMCSACNHHLNLLVALDLKSPQELLTDMQHNLSTLHSAGHSSLPSRQNISN